jgi:hypothetical protein
MTLATLSLARTTGWRTIPQSLRAGCRVPAMMCACLPASYIIDRPAHIAHLHCKFVGGAQIASFP